MMKFSFRSPMSELYAAGYAAYMLTTGYFAASRCASPLMEKRLLLYYRDLARVSPAGSSSWEAQYRLEDKILRVLDREIDEERAARLSGLAAEVSFLLREDRLEILFDTGLPAASLTLVLQVRGSRYFLTVR